MVILRMIYWYELEANKQYDINYVEFTYTIGYFNYNVILN